VARSRWLRPEPPSATEDTNNNRRAGDAPQTSVGSKPASTAVRSPTDPAPEGEKPHPHSIGAPCTRISRPAPSPCGHGARNLARWARYGDGDTGRRAGGPPIEASAAPPFRRRRTNRAEGLAIAAAALAAGASATVGGAAPTGTRTADLAYVALAGAVLSLAGSRSHPVPWLVSGVAVFWIAPTTTGRVIAITVMVLAVYARQTGRRPVIGAVVGALMAFVLGDLGGGPSLGATTMLALLASAPILVSAAVLLPQQQRRTIGLGASVWAAAAGLATLMFGLSALLAIDTVGDGVDAANRGFELSSDGDRIGAGAAFESASAAFDDAHGKVSGFWTLPARVVPIVAQHVEAVQVVASEGVALAKAAGETTRSVDLENVRLVGGGLDLALIESLEPALDRAEAALDRALTRVADVRSPWLLSPIDDKLSELLEELTNARPSARTAALAARELPGMLGVDGPVYWLVAMTSPAQARGLGGLLDNWVLVEADEGRLEIVLSGRAEEVSARLRSRQISLEGPEQYIRRWGRFSPEESFRDVTLSPDLPMVAEIAANLFEEAMDRDIDGVVFLDPFAFAAVLELSGPVLAGGSRLTDVTVAPFLLEGQYVEFAGNEIGRILALNELVQGAFAAFTDGDLPGPRAIAEVLGPMVEQDRMGVWWQPGGGPDELIDATGLDGRFPDAGSGDLLALVHQNRGGSRLDGYLRRDVDYRLRVADGAATATMTVTLRNQLTDTLLPDSIIGNDRGSAPGTNLVRLTIHTSLDLRAARLDGRVVTLEQEEAFDRNAVTALVDIAPGETRVLELELGGPVTWSAADYRLTLPHQPLVNDDTIRLDVEIDGAAPIPASSVVLSADTVLGPGAET
jgi:uncharacterized protein DUF4012